MGFYLALGIQIMAKAIRGNSFALIVIIQILTMA
jgi:hypothetical protein